MRRPLTTTLLEWMSTCVRHVGLHGASVRIEVPNALYDAMAREAAQPVAWRGQPLDLCVHGPGLVATIRREPEQPAREKSADPCPYVAGEPPVSLWYAGTIGMAGAPPHSPDCMMPLGHIGACQEWRVERAECGVASGAFGGGIGVAVPKTQAQERLGQWVKCHCGLQKPHLGPHAPMHLWPVGDEAERRQRAAADVCRAVQDRQVPQPAQWSCFKCGSLVVTGVPGSPCVLCAHAESRQVRAQQQANARGMKQEDALRPPPDSQTAYSAEERNVRDYVARRLSLILYPSGTAGFGGPGLEGALAEVAKVVAEYHEKYAPAGASGARCRQAQGNPAGVTHQCVRFDGHNGDHDFQAVTP